MYFLQLLEKLKASTPQSIDMEEDFENVEENGFSIIDIDSRNVSVKMFKFLWSRDNLKDIENLVPFITV